MRHTRLRHRARPPALGRRKKRGLGLRSSGARAQAVAQDRDLYKNHHSIECFINNIKLFRRIATRYDKTAPAFISMNCIACMLA
jgi:transposase